MVPPTIRKVDINGHTTSALYLYGSASIEFVFFLSIRRIHNRRGGSGITDTAGKTDYRNDSSVKCCSHMVFHQTTRLTILSSLFCCANICEEIKLIIPKIYLWKKKRNFSSTFLKIFLLFQGSIFLKIRFIKKFF